MSTNSRRSIATDSLNLAAIEATTILKQLAPTADFFAWLRAAFGEDFDPSLAGGIAQQWKSGDFSLIPEIQVVTGGELGTANGAYAADLDTIFVSAEFLARHQDDRAAVVGLLLEEIGHKLDRVLNGNVDSPGDEGAVFRLLVTGQAVSAEALAGLRRQDDRSIIAVDGVAVAVERQDFFGDAGGVVTNDNIVGTAGDDNISPGLGQDTVNGGAGNDTLIVDYSANNYTGANPPGIVGTFNTGSGRIRANKGAANDFDQVNFSNIENLRIVGTKYNDDIVASTGVDIIDGGIGFDRVTVNISSLNVNNNIDLSRSNITLANGTQLLNIERFGLTTGAGDDTITGAIGGSRVTSGAGNDTIIAGNDTIRFDSLTIDAGTGNDTIVAGTGRANVNGGDGIDTLVVDYSANDYTGTQPKGLTASFSTAFVGAGDIFVFTGSANNQDSVSFTNIENVNITGTKYDDKISGSTGSDILKGGAGNDILTAGGVRVSETGVVIGGVDLLDGGDGFDTAIVDIAGLNGNSNIDLNRSNITLANGTQLLNLEKFTLSVGTGDDTIVGSNSGDTLNTGAGNDTISGGSGNDTINAGVGNDTINAGGGINTVNGGDGIDTLIVDYSDNDNISSSGISSSFSAGVGTISVQKGSGGDIDRVDFSNIERLQLTGTKYADNIGSNGIDTLTGGTGKDNFILTNYVTQGNNDYAIIKDFNIADDRVTLGAAATGFSLSDTSPISGVTGAALFKGTDLVAVFEGLNVSTLNSGDLAGQDRSTAYNLGSLSYSFDPDLNRLSVTRAIVNEFVGQRLLANDPSDFYKVEFTYDSELSVQVDSNVTRPTLEILDSNGIVVARASTDVRFRNAVQPTVPAGQYFIAVSGLAAGQGTNYRLSAAAIPLPQIVLGGSGGGYSTEFSDDDRSVAGAGAGELPTIAIFDDGNRFTLTRSGRPDAALTVNYTIGGTATNEVDYQKLTGIATFRAGSDTATIDLIPIDDDIIEGAETVILTLAEGGTSYTLDPDRKSVTKLFTDNEKNDGGGGDGDGGGTGVPTIYITSSGNKFTLTRLGTTSADLTVNYRIGGTATNEVDYQKLTGIATFRAGSDTATIDLIPIDDNIDEPTETIILSLIDGGASYLLDADKKSATISLVDDEIEILPPPTISISLVANDSTAGETTTTEPANPGQFTLTRTGDLTQSLAVNYTLTGTATSVSDYQSLPGTVTFAANASTATIDLNIVDNNIFEATESVTLELTANAAYTLATANSTTVNILDNDRPTISINDVSLTEGNSGTTTATFTVALSNPSSLTTTVDYATADGTTTAGSDYNAVSLTTLIFNPGETSKNITVSILGDTTVEPDETFKVELSNPTNATLGTITAATGTIRNDDTIVLPLEIIGTPQNDLLNGTSSNETIYGLAANDTINAGAGNDIIFGGAGTDNLFGGAGRDAFAYNSPTEGFDKINDFVVSDDLFGISRTGFGGNTVFGSDPVGTLDATRFGIGTAATTASQRFVYNARSGTLFFDADGNGTTSTQVRIAQLVGIPALTTNNFTLI
jgi:Ca2+-binding RTX toxin-like protein